MARLPTVGSDNGNWGSILNEFLQVEHNTDGSLKNFKGAVFADVTEYGAIMGSSVSAAQKAANLTALHAARDAVTTAGFGIILIPGILVVNGMCNFEDLGDTKVAVAGLGGGVYASRIVCDASSTIDYLFSLKGTRRFQMVNITLDANGKAKYALYCARTSYPSTAGKHYFEHVYMFNATVASHLNYASEENTYVKCQFQRSPIGCIVTGYPVVTDPTVVNASPVDFSQTWQDMTATYFYDCAFGSAVSANPTPRCGLMVCGGQVNLFGGIIQTSQDAESGVIIDRSPMMSTFSGVNWDSGLPKIALKIGHFTSSESPRTDWANRIHLYGGDIGISNSAGTDFIDAYNLRDSVIGPVNFGNTSAYEIVLRDNQCINNTFFQCAFRDGTPVTIDDAATTGSNLQIARGRIKFLSGSSAGTEPELYFNSSLVSRLTLTSGLALNPPTGVTPFQYLRSGTDTSSLFAITEANNGGVFTAQLNWGSGSAAVDTNLYRASADNLKTDDTLQVGTGAWNAGHLRMGNYHLWIDASGNLRMKNGAPTSDTDGTVVGSQT